MISDSNEQPQQQLDYNLLKPDCHMQFDSLEEGYAIKLYFKLGKNATEMYRMLQFRRKFTSHGFTQERH